MESKLDFATVQHLCGLVSRFFDHIAECSPEYGEDIYAGAGDFASMCRDFTFDLAELDAAGSIDKSVTALAREILALAE